MQIICQLFFDAILFGMAHCTFQSCSFCSPFALISAFRFKFMSFKPVLLSFFKILSCLIIYHKYIYYKIENKYCTFRVMCLLEISLFKWYENLPNVEQNINFKRESISFVCNKYFAIFSSYSTSSNGKSCARRNPHGLILKYSRGLDKLSAQIKYHSYVTLPQFFSYCRK